VRLLLDEMHAGSVARALTAEGFDVVAVCEDRDLRGRADDEILGVAASQDRAVVTENVRDFAALAERWARTGRPYPGIVVTSPDRFNRAAKAYPGNLIAALRAFLAAPPVEGQSWVWWL
jgi:predicted nuclease of predicted toxin-antitoxin system